MTQMLSHILITGAASGIGAACARQLSQNPCLLCLHTGSNIDGLMALAEELKDTGNAEILCFTADFSTSSSAERLIAELKEKAGYIDQLVLNAGYAEKGGLDELSPERLERALSVMTCQPAQLLSAFLPDIMASGCGRIVSVSSFVNKFSDVNNNHFSVTAAAKSALEALTMSAARQMRYSGSTANIVSPGYTKKDSDKSALTKQEWQGLAKTLPLGRLVKPEEVAALICYLLSDKAAMITGQMIEIDSGLSLI